MDGLTNEARPITDLSRQAVQIGRILDRLPPGQAYLIQVVKPDLHSLPWRIEVSRFELIRRMEPRDV